MVQRVVQETFYVLLEQHFFALYPPHNVIEYFFYSVDVLLELVGLVFVVIVDSVEGRVPEHGFAELMGFLAGKGVAVLADEGVAFAGFGDANDGGGFPLGAFGLIHEDSIIREIKLK